MGKHQYITWITNDQAAWTLDASGMTADSSTEISDRPIPQEPMVRYRTTWEYTPNEGFRSI